MIGMSDLGTMGGPVGGPTHKFLWAHVPMGEDRARRYAKEPALALGAVGEMYKTWGAEVQAELAAIEGDLKASTVVCVPIYVKRPAQQWVYDNNVVLIGDAAHAYGPGGHGLNNALQDAKDLSAIIAGGMDAGALIEFQGRRGAVAAAAGAAADKRNKGRLVPAGRWKVWVKGWLVAAAARVFRLLGWRIDF